MTSPAACAEEFITCGDGVRCRESLERVEVGVGDCRARDRPRLAKEALPTLLVPIIAAQKSWPASNQRQYPITGEDDGRSQRRLGPHHESMENSSNWESRFPNAPFPGRCRNGAQRHRRRGEPSWIITSAISYDGTGVSMARRADRMSSCGGSWIDDARLC
jgi:hypothetical protein